ncbi:hypothetical protein [Streptomyces lydicus]|uniref:hypothetical protein n=1 Tax=Streptomyces lydicus TaxID=47763 RepID=UPI0010111A4B|nr:hypothetical protein [Streptomyces lydicus]MCZ1012096.1 hypothetical protein [Streptomyces lydicus]
MNDQHRPHPPAPGETDAEHSDVPSGTTPPSEAVERQQVIKLTAEAVDLLQDAIAAGEEGDAEWLGAMNQVQAARAMGISDEEITAARRADGTVYRIAYRNRAMSMWPYLSKARAFDECTKRARQEHPDAVLEWGTAGKDGEADPRSPWLLFRHNENGDLVDTGFTVTPLPTKLRPVSDMAFADEQI